MKKISELKEEINKENKNQSIISNQFLVNEEKSQSVDINTNQIKINLKEINIEPKDINLIEIDEIVEPKIYSINSIIEYFQNCIFITQILPSFIRYAVINNNSENKNKATKILSQLYDLNKSIENNNHCFISPILKEYKQSCDTMFSILKNSGLDFSKDEKLKNLENINEAQIKNFIITPQKDNFIIRKNNFEIDSNEEFLI